MNLEVVVALGFYAFAFVAGGIVVAHWARWRLLGRRNRGRWGFYPSAAASALPNLQAIMEPHVQHVVVEMEETDEDDAPGPEDPTDHLLRQAKRIRRGKAVDRLTAIWREPPPHPIRGRRDRSSPRP